MTVSGFFDAINPKRKPEKSGERPKRHHPFFRPMAEVYAKPEAKADPDDSDAARKPNKP